MLEDGYHFPFLDDLMDIIFPFWMIKFAFSFSYFIQSHYSFSSQKVMDVGFGSCKSDVYSEKVKHTYCGFEKEPYL